MDIKKQESRITTKPRNGPLLTRIDKSSIFALRNYYIY